MAGVRVRVGGGGKQSEWGGHGNQACRVGRLWKIRHDGMASIVHFPICMLRKPVCTARSCPPPEVPRVFSGVRYHSFSWPLELYGATVWW